MATHDPQDFFGLIRAAFQRHAHWRRGPNLNFSEDLPDAEVFGVLSAKRAVEFVVSLNEGRLLSALLAGPSGCGGRWADALVAFLEAVDAGGIDLFSLTVAQIVD